MTLGCKALPQVYSLKWSVVVSRLILETDASVIASRVSMRGAEDAVTTEQVCISWHLMDPAEFCSTAVKAVVSAHAALLKTSEPALLRCSVFRKCVGSADLQLWLAVIVPGVLPGARSDHQVPAQISCKQQ